MTRIRGILRIMGTVEPLGARGRLGAGLMPRAFAMAACALAAGSCGAADAPATDLEISIRVDKEVHRPQFVDLTVLGPAGLSPASARLPPTGTVPTTGN